MAVSQKYGIKYPFENRNTDGLYVDLNETKKDDVKSRVLHVLFTQKGRKLRDPEFGTDLIKYLFEPSDSITDDDIIKSVSKDLKKFVPDVTLEKITITSDEGNENSKILLIHYSVTNGNNVEHTTAAIKI